jgi:hypothetical protein
LYFFPLPFGLVKHHPSYENIATSLSVWLTFPGDNSKPAVLMGQRAVVVRDAFVEIHLGITQLPKRFW